MKYKDPRGLVPYYQGLPRGGITKRNVVLSQESRWAILKWPSKIEKADCPFCESQNIKIEVREERDDEEWDRKQNWNGYMQHIAVCMDCGAHGPEDDVITPEGAARAWSSVCRRA